MIKRASNDNSLVYKALIPLTKSANGPGRIRPSPFWGQWYESPWIDREVPFSNLNSPELARVFKAKVDLGKVARTIGQKYRNTSTSGTPEEGIGNALHYGLVNAGNWKDWHKSLNHAVALLKEINPQEASMIEEKIVNLAEAVATSHLGTPTKLHKAPSNETKRLLHHERSLS